MRRATKNFPRLKALHLPRLLTAQLAQSTIEYLLILLIVLAAILGSNFIHRMRNPFKLYFDKAVAEIVK